MTLAQMDGGPAAMGAVGWIGAVLMIVLLCAAIVLAVVLIQYLLAKTRALQGDVKLQGEVRPPEAGRSSVAVSRISSSVAFTPDYRSAAAVPPENPHSGPTPTLSTPRPRPRG